MLQYQEIEGDISGYPPAEVNNVVATFSVGTKINLVELCLKHR
jgi:TATA-box binding protein (TBP) (component of TFIID and TFIIIB)